MNCTFLDGVNLVARGRVPSTVEFKTGPRQDVGRLLEGCGVLPYRDAFQLLAHAWHADVLLSRFPDHREAALTDREVHAFIVDVSSTTSNSEECTKPATLSGLYLAGEQHVAKCLAAALRHPRTSHRRRAASLCEALWDPRWLEYFAEIDFLDPPEAFTASLRLYCRLGDERHLPQLQRAFAHPDEIVCLEALKAIKRLSPAAALAMLDGAAKFGRPVVSVSALIALGELGDLSLMPRLMQELDSENSFRRIGAARGLAALALRCPNGDYSSAMEALQKKARLGGVEYRRALKLIRRAIGIDPELPIPAGSVELRTKSLPIPDERGDSALFEPNRTPQQLEKASNESDVEEDASLSRRLNNMLPRPDTWEYD